MDLNNSLFQMLEFTKAEGAPGPFSCVRTVAAALPKHSDVFRAYEYFEALPAAKKRRALRNPLAAARLAAAAIHAKRCESRDGGLWGVADTGRYSFALCVGGKWWARSDAGLSRVHSSRIVLAWEIA